MAMACFGLVTFFPLRPIFNLPSFISCISLSTFLPAEGEYLRPEDFFERELLEVDFLADDPRVLFFAPLLREERLEDPLREERLELPLRDERLLPLLRDERERDPLPFDLLLDPLLDLELLPDFFFAAFLVAITILLGSQMACTLRQVASTDREWLPRILNSPTKL